jgi:hypothetical protein
VNTPAPFQRAFAKIDKYKTNPLGAIAAAKKLVEDHTNANDRPPQTNAQAPALVNANPEKPGVVHDMRRRAAGVKGAAITGWGRLQHPVGGTPARMIAGAAFALGNQRRQVAAGQAQQAFMLGPTAPSS